MNPPVDNPDRLTAAVAEHIGRRTLLPTGATIVVGVSGGADSVVLLAVLRDLSREPDHHYQLHVAHLNHGLRPGADEDEAFVANLARQWDIPCTTDRCDVSAEAARRGIGIEQAAREVRYEALERLAAECGASAVAVGHHADDRAETILHHVLRGTHLRGLRGMPPARNLDQAGHVRLVRPLLETRRQEVLAFCRRHGLSYRTDPTNRSTEYSRNFLRHELLPLVRERINPQVDQALLRLADAAEQAEGLLDQLGRSARDAAEVDAGPGWLALDASALADQPAMLRTYALRAALQTLGLGEQGLTAEHLANLAELCLPHGPSGVSLPGDFHAERQVGEVFLRRPDTPSRPDLPPVELTCPGTTPLPDGRRIHCHQQPPDADMLQAPGRKAQPGVELLDADRIHGRLVCRPRREGDRFRPLGAPGRQSVTDLLINAKLPHRQREEVLAICDAEGIVYLAPVRLADRVRLTRRTRRILRIAVE